MKHLFALAFVFFASLMAIELASAQSFTNPIYTQNGLGAPSDFRVDGKYVNDPSDPVVVPATGSKSVGITAQLYRLTGTTTVGYVNVYYGTSPTNLSAKAIASKIPVNTYGWVPSTISGYELLYLSANASLSKADATGYTGIYAVYFSTPPNGNDVKGETSIPVLLKIEGTTPPPPPTTPPPTTPTIPLSYYIPCQDQVICDDQCVVYGTQPALIKGRVLADNGDAFEAEGGYGSYTEYDAYYYTWGSPFASGWEHEWAQWQSSPDKIHWYDIPNAIGRNYQPGALYQPTHFRRVSTHLEGNFHKRTYWYTSNVVTISLSASAPVASQDRYKACGTAPVTITLRSPANAISYTWAVTHPGVLINGKSTYPTYSVTTTEFAVQVTMPVGATLGSSYPIYVSATGQCGASSPTTTVYIDADCAAPAPTNASFVAGTNTSTCRPTYDVRVGAVMGASSYTATLHGNSLYEGASLSVTPDPSAYYFDFPFNIPGPVANIYVTVTATSAGVVSSPFTSAAQSLTGPGGNCANFRTAVAREGGETIYPNPASEQVTLAGTGQDMQIDFYDSQGVCRRSTSVSKQDSQRSINTRDLPAGLYHIRTTAQGKVLKDTPLVIQH